MVIIKDVVCEAGVFVVMVLCVINKFLKVS